MSEEKKTIVYDQNLDIEAYYFDGKRQAFPNHSHEYYVIGFVEQGHRKLICNKKCYIASSGSFILLNPGDRHYCDPNCAEEYLEYRVINVKVESMRKFCGIDEQDLLPMFDSHVVVDAELEQRFIQLHNLIVSNQANRHTDPEGMLVEFLRVIVGNYSKFEVVSQDYSCEVRKFTEALRENYDSVVGIDELCAKLGIGRRIIFRLFTKEQGITPHRYVLTLRLSEARRLLAQGMVCSQVAMQLGFSDQPHFIRFFKSLMGVTPKEYMKVVSID